VTQSAESAVPKFAAGVRLHYDKVRAAWILQAPERVIIPDETALEILRRCNGRASLGAIIDDLAAAYDEKRDVIAADVCRMVDELAGKGILSR
jgi:pyrroloquinoline quinone biosynthesis protein D